MKRTFLILLGLLLAFPLSVRAMAADGPVITLQPQNPHYPEYSVAIYSVKADGSNLTCTWYLEYEGTTYNISDNSNATEPWEGYAGSSYGPSQNGNTFHYIFNGIEDGLNGAAIYCVIEDGHYSVQSDKAIITVMGSKMPPQISVQAKISARIGEDVDLRCIATAPANEQLTYIWYETRTGKLQDIIAMPDESEYSDYIICDTSSSGTRYYVCGVQTSTGGMAYSSVIPVSVTGRPFEPQMSQPSQKDISSVAITDLDAPVAGQSPDCFAAVGGEGYDFQKTNTADSFGGISWYDVTEGRYIPLASEFVAGHEYQVYIELVAGGDYQFAYPDGTVNGNAAEVFGNTGAVTVCYVFPPCKAENASSPQAAPAEPEKPAESSPASSVPPSESSNAPLEAAPAPSSDTVSSASSEVSEPGKPSEAEQPSAAEGSSPTIAPSKEQSTGMPLWGVLLCITAAMAAGVGITLAVMRKKRGK